MTTKQRISISISFNSTFAAYHIDDSHGAISSPAISPSQSATARVMFVKAVLAVKQTRLGSPSPIFGTVRMHNRGKAHFAQF